LSIPVITGASASASGLSFMTLQATRSMEKAVVLSNRP
jgi:hypothetical protein